MLKGYVFEYYKYVRYSKDSISGLQKSLNTEEAVKCLLTFGEYDRLKINNITRIDRYRDLSALAKEWVGNRRAILLYDLDDEPRFIYEENQDGGGFKEVGSDKKDEHLFLALTELSFRSILREKISDYEEFLKET